MTMYHDEITDVSRSISVHGATVEVDGTVHQCATARVAAVYAARLALEAAGWIVRGPSSGLPWRRPMLLAGEKMGNLLDGSRSDERATGLVVFRRQAEIAIDATAGLAPTVLMRRGDVDEVLSVVVPYLGAPA